MKKIKPYAELIESIVSIIIEPDLDFEETMQALLLETSNVSPDDYDCELLRILELIEIYREYPSEQIYYVIEYILSVEGYIPNQTSDQ